MYYQGLMHHAQQLLGGVSADAAQADLRRAISAAYYALFHCYLFHSAVAVYGGGEEKAAIRNAYIRSVSHGEILSAAIDIDRHLVNLRYNRPLQPAVKAIIGDAPLPPALGDFCRLFPFLQAQRHQMDYDWADQVSQEEAAVTLNYATDAIAAVEGLAADKSQALAHFAT